MINIDWINMKRLTSSQAAARLQVKPATLYSYVSRGLLHSERSEDERGSTFDPLEVEALARRRRRRTDAPVSGSPLMVVDSAITLLRDDELYFRGVPAVELARRAPFEEVAGLLWEASEWLDFTPFGKVIETVQALRLPDARPIDWFQQSLLVSSIHDPVKWDPTPTTARGMVARAIGTMVEVLPQAGTSGSGSLAASLWGKLSPAPPEAADVTILNAALVLLADHDLAASTLAGRVAASARAHPYAALMAAFGAFDSALHGHASTQAAAMLEDALATGNPEAAISRAVASGRGIPGFGHVLYARRDPRAHVLLGLMRAQPRYREVSRVADRIAGVVVSRTNHMPNIDLALAVLTTGAGMVPDAGPGIFGLARTAGWTAHILEEYAQPPMRMRPSGNYVGNEPASRR
ncbi:citrate synthase [Arthrobacter pigmenti]|uniref:citrate synthase (unknown stereospecificity) n=1 Tax=Arthrobacter pigmenti TaxID=271432 RepID=A0A846RNQ6_9MICC|nr:citrate synthase [Arthrobacter pigmenti]